MRSQSNQRRQGWAAWAIAATLTGLGIIVCPGHATAAPEPTDYEVGLAKVDITPDYNIRLSGFAARKTESVGVRAHIFARAMAIRANGGGESVVLVTVDSIGIPMYMRDEVARRLLAKKKLANERFAICATHSHTTPVLARVLLTLFDKPIPPDQQERIDRYTRDLTDKIEQAALAALDDLKPGRLAFGIGNVGFSINRRTRGGPVDHDLPVMSIVAPGGKVRGIWVNYACHCVVLSDFKVSGDWAGYAAEELEKQYPDSVVLVSVGCGADSNPQSGVTGDKGEVAQQYGHEVATEVERLLRLPLTTINDPIECKLDTISLALQPLPAREQWTERAKAENADGYYAKVQLARLDAGEKLPTEIAYPVQTWKFGKSLATVFLSGEVVVDYALRLKKEFDSTRLWVNAYSNDVPAYIPSERVLKEGGYEGGGAMIYYGVPAPFAPGLEDKIIAAASGQLGAEFKPQPKKLGTQGSVPKSPAESLATIQVRDGMRIELVAAEPMVQSPVAIDFGPDGKLWVAEMKDYGCKDGETCPPAGRVSVLEDRDSNGTFETATVFLDKIAEPMGVCVWRKGVLISAAPDLIYAEDTNGDGKADVVQKLFTGFSVENPQARLNTLSAGLDGWLQSGCMFVGKIRNQHGHEFDIGNRDFRLRPDAGEIDAENGKTENARVRDDWGNWFGCENGVLCFHYPLPDRYLRRNAHIVPPALAVNVPNAAAAQLYPRGKLVLFELSGPAGRATAACGLTFYRDELLGPEFIGNAFTCEPVNQLVHRTVLHPKGATFVGERAADETESEFLTSTDNWFRPVQARTGPDGALWVVDMYRYVIEHTRWIPKKTQDELDVYAGNTLGRIYRVLPRNAKSRPLPRLDKLEAPQLAAAMDSPNGTQRDMVQQLLVWRGDAAAAEPLLRIAVDSPHPAARLQALCTLDLLGKLRAEQIESALADPHPGVRRQAVRLAESRFTSSPKLLAVVLKLADDPDAFVAQQLACSLGETDDSRKIKTLTTLLQKHATDEYVATGVMASVNDDELDRLLKGLFFESAQLPIGLWNRLFELAGAGSSESAVAQSISLAALHIVGTKSDQAKPDQFAPLDSLLAGLRRNPRKADVLTSDSAAELQNLSVHCLHVAEDADADVATRAICIRIVGRTPQLKISLVKGLVDFLSADHDSQLQLAAIDALAERNQPDLAQTLLSGWRSFTPPLRMHVLDVLLTRKKWVAALLAAVEGHTIMVSEIDAAHRARLTGYPDADLRRMAAASFSPGTAGERAALVARYQTLLKKGDAERGKAVFQKNCAACHKVHDIGTQVGPDMAAREDKSNEGFLREILDPNRAVDQRFAEYVAVTSDGIVKNGILVEETGGAITLRSQQGQETKLLRSELDSLTSSGKSLMPEGFENQISPDEMSDLLAFLASP
ncbi:MAG: neutral/alkaline non-lysosomal ceramidase N-terminal domain-containing protein [Pirellulales bacterium]